MTSRDRKRIKRLKYLFVLLGLFEVVVLISCIRHSWSDDDSSFDRHSSYGLEDIQLNPVTVAHDEDPVSRTEREQLLKDAEERNSAILGLDNDHNVVIP